MLNSEPAFLWGCCSLCSELRKGWACGEGLLTDSTAFCADGRKTYHCSDPVLLVGQERLCYYCSLFFPFHLELKYA